MPNHEEHCADSLKRYGKTFSEMHRWMDEPSLILGAAHRKYRHDPNVTPAEAKSIFGENADNACLDHIRLDVLEAHRSTTTVWSPNTDYDEIESVLPVVRFTITSPAGAWHFESKAISFSKDGKTHYCFRSSSLSQKSIQEPEEVNNAIEEEDEDEEWEDDPDNPEGEP
ncbi:MAG: hypothetical protein ABSD42_04000 [Candidatus Bathyarchaeia archaeon]|jgi:hypothetical protein